MKPKSTSRDELMRRVMALPPDRRSLVIETALSAVKNHELNRQIKKGTARSN